MRAKCFLESNTAQGQETQIAYFSHRKCDLRISLETGIYVLDLYEQACHSSLKR